MTLSLAALRALCSAATPGPWVIVRQGEDRWVDTLHDVEANTVCELQGEPSAREADAAFVLACRSAVPELLDRLEAAEAALSAMRGALSLRKSKRPVFMSPQGLAHLHEYCLDEADKVLAAYDAAYDAASAKGEDK